MSNTYIDESKCDVCLFVGALEDVRASDYYDFVPFINVAEFFFPDDMHAQADIINLLNMVSEIMQVRAMMPLENTSIKAIMSEYEMPTTCSCHELK